MIIDESESSFNRETKFIMISNNVLDNVIAHFDWQLKHFIDILDDFGIFLALNIVELETIAKKLAENIATLM